jgi:rubrerythrin
MSKKISHEKACAEEDERELHKELDRVRRIEVSDFRKILRRIVTNNCRCGSMHPNPGWCPACRVWKEMEKIFQRSAQ